MTSPHSFSFSRPAMPGDALSVLVLVEDSAAMATKWPDVQDSYLPNLLETLRTADPSVEMEARWLTTSSTSSVSPAPIVNAAQARNVPELPLGRAGSAKLSPTVITHALSILSSETRRQNTTRHLILVAATGPLTQGTHSDATPSGFDPWQELAYALQQHCIRLHVILSIGAEMRTYHELFKRSLQLQNNSEVVAWFPADPGRYSIRLSGRPQSVRGSVGIPVSMVPTTIPEDPYNNPSPPVSYPTPVSPPSTVSTPGSPTQTPTQSGRKSSQSPTTPRSRPRGSDSPQSPPPSEGGGGLVSYLQQMHGLTKKKSYGIKAPKKTYADIRLPNAGRPILPRLEVPSSQSDIYTYPSFRNLQGSEAQVLTSDAQLPLPRRHSVDQFPTSSLVARTSNEDRRARRRGPWLPIAPLVSSTPSSPTSTASPGTLAALQSLASMRPRLPDFVMKDRMHTSSISASADDQAAYAAAQSTDPVSSNSPGVAYYTGNTVTWANSSAPSPTHTVSSSFGDISRQFQASPPTPSLVGSDYTYRSSPPSSTTTTPPSMAAPMGESLEDQPFVVTPEYEAIVNARFEEAIRSGAMQASMTSAVPALSSPSYTPSNLAPAQQEQMFHPAHGQQAMSSQETGYAVYYSSGYAGDEMSAAHGIQGDSAWPYPAANSYIPPFPEYAQPQGQWYS